MDIQTTLPLNDGRRMPYLGLGTYQGGGYSQMEGAVRFALEFGYRHIDTAEMYDNEQYVGAGLKKSAVPRGEIFLTSKVWPANFGYDSTKRACQNSLKRLGTDYLDLYLLHWPQGRKILDSWQALIDLQKDGLVRSIGVSNFSEQEINAIVDATGVIPAVNQVEFHPFNYTKGLLDYCRALKIVLEAYTSLTRGAKFSHPVVQEVANRCGKTPAQVLLRWALQHAVPVIPKSRKPERIRENADIFDFEITSAEMAKLNSLDEGFRVW